jgi:hypothetical protein
MLAGYAGGFFTVDGQIRLIFNLFRGNNQVNTAR